MASATSPTPPWVILGSVPRVLSAAAAAASLPPGPGSADFSLELPPPPRVALLTIPPRIFPSRPTRASYPCVLAADSSAGLLLLHADQGHATGPTVIDKPGHQQFGWLPFVAGYFVLHAATGSALPLPTPELVSYKGDLGLIAYPDGAGYVVAELQPVFGSDKAVLLRFSSQVGEWVSKRVAYPLPARLHNPDGVVSCYGRLWWVDLSWSLVTCDPFADDPVLTRVKLPEGTALKYRVAWGLLEKYRCVGVSAGKLRFVDMYRNSNSNGAAQISVWTLADYPPYSTEWTLDCEATFAEICNDASYKATGLPRKIPVLALIHPTNPDVVYFFQDEHLIGVDVRARKVVGCEVYELVDEPPCEGVSSRFVHAWQLPPSLSLSLCSEDYLMRFTVYLYANFEMTVVSEVLQRRQSTLMESVRLSEKKLQVTPI
ncbi:uncharacterized protein [Triticum aestivum]|uniref:uncharacterized protein n=1 Tax=Triticum aestivum TaxID=4565 RepID=UPI001D019F8E|nr:uncharacterized protein LOC123067366 [Triticum aestivum]